MYFIVGIGLMVCIIFGGWYQWSSDFYQISDRRCLVDEQFGKCHVKLATGNI